MYPPKCVPPRKQEIKLRLNVCGTAQMMKQRFQIRFSGDGDEERMKEDRNPHTDGPSAFLL